jgi:hypothetical protein
LIVKGEIINCEKGECCEETEKKSETPSDIKKAMMSFSKSNSSELAAFDIVIVGKGTGDRGSSINLDVEFSNEHA